MRVVLALGLAAFVAGCAQQATGNAQGGVVPRYGSNDSGTFQAAQAHCAKFGKDARITQIATQTGGSAVFDCVAK